ncbi:TetR/AcrR family transcriptional regulator [Lactobacillus sp. ESL0791]|uniref:TetR/AcrR family transcriptional regulator n=1 Tax=Lactobacillus sp. ESL0791 TaxID=2983234 RepID=UPI0023F8EE3A|nr:TetR/AcrR family transcriptional regulator [Lactobacillus sp. ESL0791]MDF7639742.1 TetR/AcrR family transcriptional regulator [Lactobacillus sp. ESL0791]
MARKKEVGKNRILDIAYRMAIKNGIKSLTARSIAKAGNFSTQPIYLEFSNMTELRDEVLGRISNTLKTKTLKKEFTGKPLIDLDLAYIDFAEKHIKQFKAMFVDGKFGSKIISDTLRSLGAEKFKEQFPDAEYDDEKIQNIVVANWVTTVGMASLIINKIATFSQKQIINVLSATIHDAAVNDNLNPNKEVKLFEDNDNVTQSDDA